MLDVTGTTTELHRSASRLIRMGWDPWLEISRAYWEGQGDAFRDDISVETELMSLHTLPPCLSDNTRANDHIILQGHSCSKGTYGMLKPPILIVCNDQNVYVRP